MPFFRPFHDARTLTFSWRAVFARFWRNLAPGQTGIKSRASQPLRAAASYAAFTPAQALPPGGRLVGRDEELREILNALLAERRHVVIYSERGRGKTSLANLVVEELRKDGVTVARTTCEAEDDFDTILHGLLRDLPASLLKRAERTGGADCSGLLPDRKLRGADILDLPEKLGGRKLVFVVDEFDRTQEGATRTRMADAMKLLSDRGADLHFLIVAVSETLDELTGGHPSVQRNIHAIHLPLLTESDIETMLRRGGKQADIAFSAESVMLVNAVARGMPYWAQLLGLRLVQATLSRGGHSVSQDDMRQAVQAVLDETGVDAQAVRAALVAGSQHEDMDDVLAFLGTAEQDRLGRLQLDRQGGAVNLGGVRLSENAFALLVASGVVGQTIANPELAYIRDRNLVTYVALCAARDSLAYHAQHYARQQG